MHIYKDFIYNIRKIEFETPHIIIARVYPPSLLYGYIRSLLAIPFQESSYNIYYGEIRKVICSFLNFNNQCSDYAVKKGEDYKNTMTYDKMMQLYEETMVFHARSHEEFLKEFQPETGEEKEKFEKINKQYETFTEALAALHEEMKSFDKQEKVDNFSKDHFAIHAENNHRMFDYTHIFISKWLADHEKEIRVSLEDIQRRMQMNYDNYEKDNEERLNVLYNELYDINKENMMISRHRSTSTYSQIVATNQKRMDAVRDKISGFGNPFVSARLEEEVQFWSHRIADLKEITTVIDKIKAAIEEVKTEEKMLLAYEPIDPPGSDAGICWKIMEENLVSCRTDLEQKYIEACRPLITFFSCTGIEGPYYKNIIQVPLSKDFVCILAIGFDRILYQDIVGAYYVDEYGHQNYMTHHGFNYYHVNCGGHFQENIEHEKYYFDENGRYVLKDGKKVYQLGPCTSYNNLTENSEWISTSECPCKDLQCMAKEKIKTCDVPIRDLTDVVLLPKKEIVNIEGTLESETVQYLWNSFGWILPEILYDVGTSNTKNPIHYLAHLLLSRSHTISLKEMKAKKKEAVKYRTDIIQKRKREAQERHRKWKDAQIKPCKTDDTAYTRSAYKVFEASQQLTTDLAMYNML